ncbi:uncharacterized protein ACO6RY_15119 [Pungitius sinensis]
MKLVVFCLLAAWCGSLVGASPLPNQLYRRKLLEVLDQVDSLQKSPQHRSNTLSTLKTPQSFEESCCMAVLRCFQETLNVQLNVTQDKLYKSLMQPRTEKVLCPSTDSGDVQANCQTCDSYQNVNGFFESLKSFIQKGITRLSK